MRSTASAVFLFINNLIGIGLGTTLIGVLSDALRVRGAGVESLRYATLSGTGFYVIASLLFFRGSPPRKGLGPVGLNAATATAPVGAVTITSRRQPR